MCKCTPNKRTPFCGAPGCEWPPEPADKSEPIENVAADNLNPIDDSREAFMAAIVKLADDEAFRESFLVHYQLWLHPPMMVTRDAKSGCIGGGIALPPGGITYMTEEEIASLRPSLNAHRVPSDGR